ncbi:MAG: hypothetical protein C4346_13540, partial [Chloroflexota bacterium]
MTSGDHGSGDHRGDADAGDNLSRFGCLGTTFAAGGRKPLAYAAREGHDALVERELSWAVTVRASPPMLPNLRGNELVIVPSRVLAESGISLEVLLSELSGRGIAGVVLDTWAPHPATVPILVADPLSPELESDINRLLTERRGEFYRAGTELGR